MSDFNEAASDTEDSTGAGGGRSTSTGTPSSGADSDHNDDNNDDEAETTRRIVSAARNLAAHEHQQQHQQRHQLLSTNIPTNVAMEPARILCETLFLPQELCDNPHIFAEFFSLDTWNGLPAAAQAHLQQFLPQFGGIVDAERTADEQARAVLGLFGGLDDDDNADSTDNSSSLSRFGVAPMRVFQANLEEGNYRPDIARVCSVIRRQQRREQRFQECERVSRMAKEMLVRRERLLRSAYDAPPGAANGVRRTMVVAAATATALQSAAGGGHLNAGQMVPKETAAQRRSRKRYYSHVASIATQAGLAAASADDGDGDENTEDEELCPGGRPEVMARKTRKYLMGLQVSCSGWF